MILRFVLLIAIAASFAACASKKPSANVYSGDSPTIHYQTKREAPGGRVETHTYR